VRLTGTHELPAAPARVWAALADDALLAAAVPDCREASSGPPRELTVTWGVAALGGVYRLRADVSEADPPAAATLHVVVEGEDGGLDAAVHAELSAHDGGTRLTWQADAQVTGALATVGSQLLAAALQRAVQRSLDALAAALDGADPAPPATGHVEAAGASGEPARDWGPLADGPHTGGGRILLAALAGALGTLLAAWLAGRLRGRR
jgi:uncharacterized protein